VIALKKIKFFCQGSNIQLLLIFNSKNQFSKQEKASFPNFYPIFVKILVKFMWQTASIGQL